MAGNPYEFHTACYAKKSDIIAGNRVIEEALINHGADINATNNGPSTFVKIVVCNRLHEEVWPLSQHDAGSNLKIHQNLFLRLVSGTTNMGKGLFAKELGNTLQFGVCRKPTYSECSISHTGTGRTLLEDGVLVNARDDQAKTLWNYDAETHDTSQGDEAVSHKSTMGQTLMKRTKLNDTTS